MVSILGKEFITDKEAADRYGYSQSWFIRSRSENNGPKYIQIKDNGRVLYPVIETDEWFRCRMEMKD